jgi:hypothetical protein
VRGCAGIRERKALTGDGEKDAANGPEPGEGGHGLCAVLAELDRALLELLDQRRVAGASLDRLCAGCSARAHREVGEVVVVVESRARAVDGGHAIL